MGCVGDGEGEASEEFDGARNGEIRGGDGGWWRGDFACDVEREGNDAVA